MDVKDHETAGCDGRDDGDYGLVQDPDDAALETLSLCDLPLYSDEYGYDDFSKDDECRRVCGSPNTDHGDPFEFSSEDLSGSGRRMCAAENIIFCGRLIPYGRDMPSVDEPSSEARGKVGGAYKPKKKKWRFFKWRLSLFRKNRSGSSNYRNMKSGDKRGSKNGHLTTGLECLPFEKYRYVPEKCVDKNGFSMGKMLPQSGRVKCRWYVLMFRPARFPVGMELQDMKMRQSRSRSLSSKFQSLDINNEGAGNGDRIGKGSRNWGLWPLLKALSCSSTSSQQCRSTVIMKKL